MVSVRIFGAGVEGKVQAWFVTHDVGWRIVLMIMVED